MEKDYTIWKIFGGYMLILLLMIMSQTTFAQSPCEGDGICVVQFNAGFNEANKVTWVNELDECKTKFMSFIFHFQNIRKIFFYSLIVS